MKHIFLLSFLSFYFSSVWSQNNLLGTTGNVGIGTLSPQRPLEISSSASYMLRLGYGTWNSAHTYDIGRNGATGMLDFFGNQSGYTGYVFGGVDGERVRIDGNGHLGIGTNAPSSKLHVKGYQQQNWISQWQNTGTSGHSMYFGYNDNTSTTYGLFITGGRETIGGVDLNVNDNLVVNGNGNVGVGTTAPQRLLELSSPLSYTLRLGYGSVNPAHTYDIGRDGTNGLLHFYGNQSSYTGYVFGGVDGETMRINSNGNVGVGTSNPGSYKLAVEGVLGARKIIVKQTTWADYVFDDQYKIPTLTEVAGYIRQYKHLPDVPSAQEVEKNGLDVGGNQAVLLKKIEELTLYAIDADKRLKEQEGMIAELQSMMKELRTLKQGK